MRSLNSASFLARALGVAALLAIPSAQARPGTDLLDDQTGTPHVVVSAGIGGGYELGGLAFGAQFGHFEPFVSLGFLTIAGGVAGGLRFVLHDDGSSTPLLTVQGGRLIGLSGENNDFVNNLWEVAALPGYRVALGSRAFVDLGIGPAVYFTWWNTPPADFTANVAFDVDLAIGVRF